MLVMVCTFREFASSMHQKYNAKSTDARQNDVRQLASATIDSFDLVTHSTDGGIHIHTTD
jgi:hypothetical protein